MLLKDAYTCSADRQSTRSIEITAAVNAKAGNPADPCEGKDQKACDADDQGYWQGKGHYVVKGQRWMGAHSAAQQRTI
eukprot:gene12323-12458_t